MNFNLFPRLGNGLLLLTITHRAPSRHYDSMYEVCSCPIGAARSSGCVTGAEKLGLANQHQPARKVTD
jgi:hypothetical protein